MKKIKGYFILFSLVFIGISFYFCQKLPEKIDRAKTRIAIISPSAGTLKSFIKMNENNIIDIPDLEYVFVVYDQAKNRYDNIKANIEEKNYQNIKLQKTEGDLDKDNLFQKNSCSKDFYRIFKNTDGILFLGGADIPPSAYGQKTSLLTNIRTPKRHYFELSFLFHLLGGSQNENFIPYLEENPEYIIYGFCLGMQTMNVATGGTMYQDIASDIYGMEYVEDALSLDKDNQHDNFWSEFSTGEPLFWFHLHRIKFIEDHFFVNKLKMNMDDFPFVPSSHHQAIKKLGKGFVVAATSMDGKIVEAITHEKYKNVLGVQYHPEPYSFYIQGEERYKTAPSDTVLYSNFNILQKKNSTNFHKKYWAYFSKLFSE
jgi:putative glutamine amidotransferase